MPQAITTKTLKELLASGSPCKACVVGFKGGFGMVFHYGTAERILSGVRGAPRLFASLNTAVSYLGQLGILKFEVDASGFQPGRLRGPRPDRAEALKGTRKLPKQERLI